MLLRLLVYEPQLEIGDWLQRRLEKGFSTRVDLCSSLEDAHRHLKAHPYAAFVGPSGWRTSEHPGIEDLMLVRRTLYLSAESLIRAREPEGLVPSVRRYVERQRLLDRALGDLLAVSTGLAAIRRRALLRRHHIDAPIELRFEESGFTMPAHALNLSARGLFIARLPKAELPSIGDFFSFTLRAPESPLAPLSGKAKVRWVREDPRPTSLGGAGFGAQILLVSSAGRIL
jgi:hypothetical protein